MMMSPKASIVLVLLLAACATLAQALAPLNAIPFTSFDSFVGTWSGRCTQTGYVNPNMPTDLTCGISLNEVFSYDFTVNFAANNKYSFYTSVFNQVGQNESFTSARINQTMYPLKNIGTATISDITNGGSQCLSVAWSDGSVSSSFLATIVRSVPSNYGIYLEEGQRQFSQTAITESKLACPSDSNQPHFCDPSTNIYSYTCYAVINLPATVV